MDKKLQNSLILNAAIEVIQNVMPTNILNPLNVFNDDYETQKTQESPDDLEDDKFLHERFLLQFCKPAVRDDTPQPTEPPILPQDGMEIDEKNDSLTYYDIIEREMTSNISDENIKKLEKLFLGSREISTMPLDDLNIRSFDQLTRLFTYVLMTDENVETTESRFDLKAGAVKHILDIICHAILQHKNKFIRWPNQREIDNSIDEFENLHENEYYEFYNVFSAIGTTEVYVQPAIPNHFSIEAEGYDYTPVKLQCCCDAGGYIQASFVTIPKTEADAKNSTVFLANPIRSVLEGMKSSENYVVSDQTLTDFPFLLTPHDDDIDNADEFNQALEAKRRTVDRTFAKIESQFQILNRIELCDKKSICELIEAICILHNFLVENNDSQYLNTILS